MPHAPDAMLPDAHPRRLSDRGRDRNHVAGAGSAWRPPWRAEKADRIRCLPGSSGYRRVRLRRADGQHPGGARESAATWLAPRSPRCCSGHGGRSSSWRWCSRCRRCCSGRRDHGARREHARHGCRGVAHRVAVASCRRAGTPVCAPGSPRRARAFAATLVSAALTGLWLDCRACTRSCRGAAHAGQPLGDRAPRGGADGAVLATVARWRRTCCAAWP